MGNLVSIHSHSKPFRAFFETNFVSKYKIIFTMSERIKLSKIPSISGNNGYSLRCKEVQINGNDAYCSYTVCQHTILAYKENRLPAHSFKSCATAIKAGKCSALKMMVEEIRKAESIYFIDMTGLIREVENTNKNKAAIIRKRDTVTISKLVKRSLKTDAGTPESQAPISDVYSALMEEVTKENT